MRLPLLLACLIFSGLIAGAHADVAVITHPANTLNTLAPVDIKRIFLQQTREYPDGRAALTATLPSELLTTRGFYQAALKMSASQWHTYWAQYEFNGQKSAPRKLPHQAAMRLWVAQTPGALGFVNVDCVDDSVKVLLTLNIATEPCCASASCD